MKYPKQPNGPSAVGAAAVRGLQTTNSAFQTKHGVGYKAQVKDGFSRVEIYGGVVYSVAGQFNIDGTLNEYGTVDFRRAFTLTRSATGVSCDFGRTAVPIPQVRTYSNRLYAYVYTDGEGREHTATFSEAQFRCSWVVGVNAVEKAGSYNVVGELFRVNASLSFFGAPDTYAVARRRYAPMLTYLGRVMVDDVPNIRLACAYLDLPTPDAPQDYGGRARLVPTLELFHSKAAPVRRTLPLPSGFHDYEDPVLVATKDVLYLLVAEKFFRMGEVRDIEKDYRPPAWLMASTDGGETWIRTNIQEKIAAGFNPLVQRVGMVPMPPSEEYTVAVIPLVDGHAVISDPAVYVYKIVVDGVTHDVTPFTDGATSTEADGSRYNKSLSDVMATARHAVCASDAFVLSCSSFTLVGNFVPARWHAKILRISGAGATVRQLYASPEDRSELIESIVFAGAGRFMAKKVIGFAGDVVTPPGFVTRPEVDDTRVGFDVAFVVSHDDGESWAEVAVSGLPAAAKSQHLGNLTVERTHSDGVGGGAARSALVLIPAYDEDQGAYFVFSTDDYGVSWKRRGRIAKPAAFLRVDSVADNTVPFDDGIGGHFGGLTRLDRRAVDLALPDRYPRKAST